MGIGVAVFLIAVGAILTFALETEVSGIDLDTVGVILMIVGAIGLLVTLLMFGGNGFGARRRVVDEEVVDGAPGTTTRRTTRRDTY